jgi:hypothetical protein
MAADETRTGPQLVSLSRQAGERARPEDFGMIGVAPADLGEGRSTHEIVTGGSR